MASPLIPNALNIVETETPLERLEALLKRISPKKAFDYADWFKIGAALYHSNKNSLYAFLAFSALAENFDIFACLAKWNEYQKPTATPSTVATLIKWANEDNANNSINFEVYKNKSTPINFTITPVATPIAKPLFTGNINKPNTSVFNVEAGLNAETQATLFFNEVFRNAKDNDYICITSDCSKPRFYRKSEALNVIKEAVKTDNTNGLFICANASKQNKRTQDRLATFDNLLIEFDDISLEEQKSILEDEKLPAATITFSGCKSLHLLFKVNAKNLSDFQTKAKVVYDYLQKKGIKFDNACKDATRFTRLAGASRNGTEQTLLGLNTGFADFQEWFSFISKEEIKSNKNIEKISLLDCLSYNEDEVYSKGKVLLGDKYLYKGSALLINAFSGLGKSTLALQLALLIAAGKNLLGGIPCHKPRKILVLQAENDIDEIKQNVKYIVLNGFENGDFTESDKETITENFVVLPDTSIGRGVYFLQQLQHLLEQHKPEIVVIDPIFGFFAGSIKDQSEVSSFFREGIQPILAKNETAAILIHHRNKPTKDDNSLPFDACNYAGAGSADLTNWVRAIINLNRYNKDPDLYFLQLCKRGEKAGNGGKTTIFLKRADDPNKPYWYEVEPPKEEAQKRQTQSKYDNRGYNFLPPLTTADFQNLIMQKENISKVQFERSIRKSILNNNKRVVYDPGKKTYTGVDYSIAAEIVNKMKSLYTTGLNITCLEPSEQHILQTLQKNNLLKLFN